MKKIVLVTTLALAIPAFAEGEKGGHFFTSWDMNGDGVVSLEDVFEKRENVLASFDADENGILNAEEYALFDEARANDKANNPNAGGGHGDKLHATMTLEFNDLNGDGEVSRAEFLVGAKAFLEAADTNGDFAVTADDFQTQ